MILEKLAGPLIGAVIGYCTNYIAVKMLFYPRKEIKIWGHKLPFTPGAIPKGKPRLAKAIGNIVANTLLTEEDLKKKILSDETENAVVEKIMDGLSTNLHTSINRIFPEEEYTNAKEKVTNLLTDQILESVQNMNLEHIIVEEAGKAVKSKTKGTMLEMFLNDEMLNSLIQPVGGEIVNYIQVSGADYIKGEISRKLAALEEKSILELCDNLNVSQDSVRGMVSSLYQTAIESAAGNLVSNLNIAGIIEEKVSEMCIDDLEKMVLSVMKKELDTIVNLGALVGAILGMLNIFI
ncbi:DUF445 domain-containing protein [Fusicatenibacter saccharivorans]|uniref:DUF445 domain-containing protein n=1 Tax=Fusicatenibacter saccharivorans TaxID=1150298 RepID=UPI003D07515C